MGKQNVIDRVRSLAEEVTDGVGVELVDVALLGKGAQTILRVTIDREGGISLKDCETTSRDLEALLDVEDPFPGKYTLEVTSAGIDRPLKTIEEFMRFQGKKARIVCTEKIESESFFVGTIQDVQDKIIYLELKKKTVRIPFQIIKKARLEIEF